MEILENTPAVENAEDTTTTYTLEQVQELLAEKANELETKFDSKLQKLKNKQGYEARKGKDSIDLDKDELILEAVAKLREEQAVLDIERKYPDYDVDTLKELKSKHPTLTRDEIVVLSWHNRAYWLDGIARSGDDGKKIYTGEEFVKLSPSARQDVLKKVQKGEVKLDTR